MYRLSEDFNTILNTYQIPNLINNLEFKDEYSKKVEKFIDMIKDDIHE